MSDRLINATAEAALLGAMLLENRLITETADRVVADDFGDALHGRIFTAMQKFSAKGMRADALTLRPLFQNDGDAQYGAYLDQLVENPAVLAGAMAIADQVRDFSARRKVRDAFRNGLDSLADDLDRTLAEIVAQVETAAAAASIGDEDDLASDVADLVGMVEERDDRICNDPGSVGISCRLVETMDNALGMLEDGTYNILAGRPGMGKTALASSAALGYAMNGNPGLYLNYEMKKEQMGIRVAADMGHAIGYRLTHSQLKKGGLSHHDRRELADIRETVRSLPMKYLTPASTDIRRLWSLVARQKAIWAAAGRELKFVVVDYIGLLTATDSEGRPIDDARKRMNVVSKMLKRMASDLGIVVIALAQLSRAVESRQNKRPMLSDLKESGDLEQDADSVLFVYRDEYYLRQAEPPRGERGQGGVDLHEEWTASLFAARNLIDFIVAKNRHGATGTHTGKWLDDFVAVRSGDFDLFNDSQPSFI